MEVKPGYKRTDLGVFPREWAVEPLGEHATFRTGPFGSALHKSDYTDDGIPVVNPMHIVDGKIEPTRTMTVTEEAARKLADFRMRSGDIIIGRRGDMGRCAVVQQQHAGWLCGTGSMIIRPRNADPEFLQRVLSSPRAIAAIEDASVGTTMVNLNQDTLAGLQLQFPPLPEQGAIATALRDVDELLGGLDRLIAKKRDLKQATMQQLLTGQTRLPGFDGKWEVASLDVLVSRTTGVWGKGEPDERNRHRAEIIRAGDISQDGELTSTATRHLTPEDFQRTKCILDDLVITTSGNGLGKVWWCDGRSNIAASNFVRVLHPKENRVVGKFLYYALRTGEGLRQLHEHTATSAYPNLRPSYFSTPWIPSLHRPEQVAIATVLSDMDAELAALGRRRDKTRDLKRAMMQEVLTGKTRLVSAGAACA